MTIKGSPDNRKGNLDMLQDIGRAALKLLFRLQLHLHQQLIFDLYLSPPRQYPLQNALWHHVQQDEPSCELS